MATNGRRTISFSKMDFVLILEGLDHVKARALQLPGEIGEFKAAACDATSQHLRVVLAKLERDADDDKTARR